MLFSYHECRKRFGSPYQIEKATRDGGLVKMMAGVYSDSGKESELEVLQFAYPRTVVTFDSAYFYYDLTDVIPDVYHLATPSNSVPIQDERIRQYYMPAEILNRGVTEIEYDGEKIRTYDLERLLIETARMKGRLPSDLYKEVILSFRKRSDSLLTEKIGDYLVGFPKRTKIEDILYEEVF